MIAAALIVALIQFAKKRGWIADQAKRLQAALGWITAFAMSFGVHFTFSGSLECGGSAGVVWPGLTELAHNSTNFAWALISQKGCYTLARIPDLLRSTVVQMVAFQKGAPLGTLTDSKLSDLIKSMNLPGMPVK